MKSGEANTIDERRQASATSLAATAYDADKPPPPPRAQTDGDPLIGHRIDHFEIRALLGEGGMGAVYLAHDLSLERPVAIKVLRRDLADRNDLVQRLVLEARAQARIQHPNVVTIYYIGQHEGAPYFAMEYVRGQTLADHLEATGPLAWPDALECAIQTTRALMAANLRGIVHRDIKPSNLIVVDEGTGSVLSAGVKVADFGLAAPPGTTEQRFVGSPYYASPEQIAGLAPDHRSDIYSLGVTLHELLTGRPPFEAGSLRDLMTMHQTAPRPPIPDRVAPWRLRQLIREMMDVDPARRPWTYEELVARLEALRPRPLIAGGLVARGMALAVDLTLLAIFGQIIAGVLAVAPRLAHEMAFVGFAFYYVVGHRVWGATFGKRLFGLKLQGTTSAVSVLRLAMRFLVEFWGPITAILMLRLQLSAATTDLAAVKERLIGLVGVDQIPILDQSTETLLRTILVPNLVMAVPWLGGFLFALFDENRQALHDRASRTRVVYSMRSSVKLPKR